ncbi:MAG: hypothetical protein ACLSBH_00285 [Coprobacillus cateniformis]
MMQIALLNTAEFDKNYENMMKYFNRVQDFYQGTYTLFNEKKTPIIDTPYEPANNLFDSLARSLAEFAQIYDPYDFADRYEDFQMQYKIKRIHLMILKDYKVLSNS